MRDSTIFYRSFWDAIKTLPKEERTDLYEAVFELSFNNKDVDVQGAGKGIMIIMAPHIKANNKRFENGNKAKTKLTESKTEAKPKQNRSKTEANKNKNKNKNDNDEIKNKNKKLKKEIVFPFSSDIFLNTWSKWIMYRADIKKPYKSSMSIQMTLNELKKYTETEAIEMIEYSIRNAYQGIFPKKSNNLNGSTVSKLYKTPEQRDDSW